MGVELSFKDRQFADLYFGGPDNCRGNAKRCWLHFHPLVKERSAEELGSRALRKVEVRQYLDSKAQKLREETEINAKWVLEQSVRLYRMAIGEIPVIEERLIEKKDKNGNTSYETEYFELRKTNLRAAVQALWLIGKHTAVQAFSQKVEVSRTKFLMERLNAQSKKVEAAAAAQPKR